MNIGEEFDKLPKCLEVARGKKTFYFCPVVFKYEHDGNPNAYIAMYAQYNVRSQSISASKSMIWAFGQTYDEAISKFLCKYQESLAFIKNRKWVGKKPQKIDHLNAE